MNILILSHAFYPSVGGTEEVGQVLAREFTSRGHVVRVVTQTAATGLVEFPFEIIRQPSPAALLRLTRWSDVFFQNTISLRSVWPLLLVRRAFVIAHHTWIARVDGRIGWRDQWKRLVLSRAKNIAVSRAIAELLGSPAEVIGNPYRDDLFREGGAITRERELVFVGRLVSDKGADILIDALALLGEANCRPKLTIIGGGPEEGLLRQQCQRLGLDAQVEFAGVQRGPELARSLNRHRFIVVPSRWQEPFGLVALEGAACGCRPVVARSGALPEAAGPGAFVFERGSAPDLADKLRAAFSDDPRSSDRWRPDPNYLARHKAGVVADRYLQVFETARAAI